MKDSGESTQLLRGILDALIQLASAEKGAAIHLDGEKVGEMILGNAFNRAYSNL